MAVKSTTEALQKEFLAKFLAVFVLSSPNCRRVNDSRVDKHETSTGSRWGKDAVLGPDRPQEVVSLGLRGFAHSAQGRIDTCRLSSPSNQILQPLQLTEGKDFNIADLP